MIATRIDDPPCLPEGELTVDVLLDLDLGTFVGDVEDVDPEAQLMLTPEAEEFLESKIEVEAVVHSERTSRFRIDIGVGRFHVVDGNDLVIGVAAGVSEETTDDELIRQMNRTDQFDLMTWIDRQITVGIDLGIRIRVEVGRAQR